MILLLVVAVALCLLVYPGPESKSKPATVSLPGLPASPAEVKKPKGPGFRDAIDCLATVRSRIQTTGGLDDKAKSAIDVLTLSLVAGSDQE